MICEKCGGNMVDRKSYYVCMNKVGLSESICGHLVDVSEMMMDYEIVFL